MKIEVLKAGLFSTIQDRGRPGYRAYGVPASGAMDEWSAAIANALVGNDVAEALIECTLAGGSFQFRDEGLIALAGADMQPLLNKAPIEMHRALAVQPGDVLKLGSARKGCRAYVAVQGSWQVDRVMGSASVYQVGGFGEALRDGEVITIEKGNENRPVLESAEGLIYLPESVKLRFIAGPEWEWLLPDQQKQFLESRFEVQSNSDRMGIRLKTAEAVQLQAESMLSSPTATGCIQLTNSGFPVVLMRDGQTTGGYPRLGTLIRMDLNRIAQLKPGDQIRFEEISYEQAVELRKAYLRNLQKLFP